MESLAFYGGSFSEYYLTRLLWEEPQLKPLLGLPSVTASFRRAAGEISRGQRALRARQLPRSTQTLLLNPLGNLLGWTLGEEETVETGEGSEDAGFPLIIEGKIVARVLAISPDAPLDLPPTGIHRRFAPALSIVRVLEEQKLTWGIVLNAFEMRLIRRAEGFVSSQISFDLTAIAEGTQSGLDAWKLLWALLRAEALVADPPLLERVVIYGREHQEGVGKALGTQVKEAVVAFVQGILFHPENQQKITRPISPDYLKQLYAESLRVLYRVLFALYGESRSLLPLDMPTYRDGYSVTRLAHRVTTPETDPRRRPTPSGRYFEWSLRALFELLRQGANLGPEGYIPQYGGALFDHSQTKLVEDLAWGDETVASVLEKLTMVPAKNRGLVRLSYRELDVEQLGAIYESLLEQVPQVASETMFRVSLDKRELIVTAAERARLARRRGEVLDNIAGSDTDEEDAPEEEADDEEMDEAEAPEEETLRPARRTPLRVLGEIPEGTMYLKAGMGRKQTGSFYTGRPLVEFLVRRAIEPLAKGKTPEEILSLKVLDPAMGSGHFLVGACRLLSEHLLSAYRKRYEEVLGSHADLPPGDVFIEAGVHPEVAANWEHEDRALTACRLLVAGNCLYGVDRNPLAVDLARVSLWLATAATDHPLTFLDHRLRVGDSLLGLPLYLGGEEEPEAHLLKPDQPAIRRSASRRKRQTSDAPLLGDVLAQEIVTNTTRWLRKRIEMALRHLGMISQMMSDAPGDFSGQRAAFEAMRGELQPFWDLHSLRVGRHFVSLEKISEVEIINRWLKEMSETGRPGEDARRLAEPARQRGEELGAFCWQLAFPEVFFGPEGQARDRCGFVAVIGNPPWDKIKPNERECFSDFDPTVWDVQGQERKRLIAALCRDNPQAQEAWNRHESETKTLSALLLEGGIYQHQIAVVEGKKTGGDPDTFKFFTERAYQLLREGGRAGIIVPLGIQGSLGTTGLRRLLLDHCQLSALIKLDNERYIFPGVFHGQKFDLTVFARGGRTEKFEAAFFSWETAEVLKGLDTDTRRIEIEAGLYRELSPEQYTFVELHDQREVELLRRIYRQFPRLGEHLDDTWNVSFVREFDMTNDSFLFRDAARLKEMGATLHSRLPSSTEAAQGAPFEPDEGGEYWTTPDASWYEAYPNRFARVERWVDSRGRIFLPGEINEERIAYRLNGYVLAHEKDEREILPVYAGGKYVPLYEGRMVHQFDHCQKAYVSGSGRRARWQELGWQEKRIAPHFFVGRNGADGKESFSGGSKPGICLVTGQTNERTALVGIIPKYMPCGHSLATVNLEPPDAQNQCFLLGLLNSFVADWILRLQVSNNIGFYHLYGLPTPLGDDQVHDLENISKKVAVLSCTTRELARLWEEMFHHWLDDFPLPWTRERACLDIRQRAKLRHGSNQGNTLACPDMDIRLY